MLSAKVVATEGGETEFASTYAAYDELRDGEKDQFETVRVVHSFEASQRLVHPDPTPEELARWREKQIVSTRWCGVTARGAARS